MEAGRRNTKSGKEETAWSVRGKRGVCIENEAERELSNTLTQVAPLVSTVSFRG